VDLRGNSRPRTVFFVTPPLVPSSPTVLQRLPQNEQCEKAHSQFNISPLLRCYLNPLQITILPPTSPWLSCTNTTFVICTISVFLCYLCSIAASLRCLKRASSAAAASNPRQLPIELSRIGNCQRRPLHTICLEYVHLTVWEVSKILLK
jgi:hypothetical protein